MIDFNATERHYADHLAPAWWALDPAMRGNFWIPLSLHGWLAAKHGIAGDTWPVWTGRPMLAAAHGDTFLRYTNRRDRHQARAHRPPIALLEHGAGQTYIDDPFPGYPGGHNRAHISLFLCTNQQVADANLAAYPSARAEVIGSPRLDRWLDPTPLDNPTPVVALSFHWWGDDAVCPEASSAFPAYEPYLRTLAADPPGVKLLGHGHPRAWGELHAFWREIGVEPVEDFDQVLARADLYVCDNSSTMYEFAATGRPVLALNAPWWRRHVEHGLRFWDMVPGYQLEEPSGLTWAILHTLEDGQKAQWQRQQAVEYVYPFRDGGDAARAAKVLEDWAQGC